MLRLDNIEKSPVSLEPFSYFRTEGALDSRALGLINHDFPPINGPGIFPLSELSFGPAFAKLIGEIDSLDLEAIMERKFGVDLSDKPLMITVRGHCQRKDGRIHTDSKDKIVTCLLYLNDTWQESGGRLRLLRIEYCQDIDGFWLEPHLDISVKLFTMLVYLSGEPELRDAGTDIYDSGPHHRLAATAPYEKNRGLMFVPGGNTWHGFSKRPISGVRKSLIVNWVTPEWRDRWELAY